MQLGGRREGVGVTIDLVDFICYRHTCGREEQSGTGVTPGDESAKPHILGITPADGGRQVIIGVGMAYRWVCV